MSDALRELAATVAREHTAADRAQQDVILHAKAAGDALLQGKAQVRHGQFGAFLRQCGDLSLRTARVYMQIAKHWSRIETKVNVQHAAHLSLRRALQIVGAPESDEQGSERPVAISGAPKVNWCDVSAPERRELRRIETELDDFPFVRRTLVEAGPGRGSDLEAVGGAAGAPVYWDIVGGDPEVGRPTFKYTRTQVRDKLRALIDTGKRSIVSDLAVDVARRRLIGYPTLYPASLPPSAGDAPTLLTVTVTLTMTERQQATLTYLLEQFDADRLVAILEDALYPHALEDFEKVGNEVAA